MTSVQKFCIFDLCAGVMSAWPMCRNFVCTTIDNCALVLSAWPLCTRFVCITSVQEFCLHDHCARVMSEWPMWGILSAWPLCTSFVCMTYLTLFRGICTCREQSGPRTPSIALLRGIRTWRAWGLVLGLNLQHCYAASVPGEHGVSSLDSIYSIVTRHLYLESRKSRPPWVCVLFYIGIHGLLLSSHRCPHSLNKLNMYSVTQYQGLK